MLENIYIQIYPPFTRTTGEPADVYHLNQRVKTLRIHDLLLIMIKNSQFLKPQNLLQLLLISICFSPEIKVTI